MILKLILLKSIKSKFLSNVFFSLLVFYLFFFYRYHEIDPATQLLLTIRFYATGQFYVATGDFGGIHKTTAGRIIKRVTNALVTLRERLIKFPEDEEGKREIKAGFYGLARFPNVIGAVDGTHIPIQSRGKCLLLFQH